MRAICSQSARTIAAALLLVCSGAESADLYLTVGAGVGESSLTPTCAPRVIPETDGYSVAGRCDTARIRGAMVDVEIGIERNGWALFLDHASNPTTSKDIGATTLGVRYQIRKRL